MRDNRDSNPPTKKRPGRQSVSGSRDQAGKGGSSGASLHPHMQGKDAHSSPLASGGQEQGLARPGKEIDSLVIGCHLSISRGLYQAGLSAISIGASSFQFFTRNPRGSRAKRPDPIDIERLADLTRENHFGPLFAHAPYTLNPCSEKDSVREFARVVLREDLERVASLPPTYYIMHPGSRGELDLVTGIELTARALDEALSAKSGVTVLLEGMSGKGSELGGTFEELRAIIDAVEHDEGLGVCLDTCHLFAAGYDIVEDLDGVVQKFDDVIGLNRLKAFHLNDSLFGLGSKKDRHAPIGEGFIGKEAIFRLINHPALSALPFNLETPGSLESWGREIALLRAAYAV